MVRRSDCLEKKLKRERILIIVEIEQLITKLALQNKIFVILYILLVEVEGDPWCNSWSYLPCD